MQKLELSLRYLLHVIHPSLNKYLCKKTFNFKYVHSLDIQMTPSKLAVWNTPIELQLLIIFFSNIRGVRVTKITHAD